jgi:hypothetical protein
MKNGLLRRQNRKNQLHNELFPQLFDTKFLLCDLLNNLPCDVAEVELPPVIIDDKVAKIAYVFVRVLSFYLPPLLHLSLVYVVFIQQESSFDDVGTDSEHVNVLELTAHLVLEVVLVVEHSQDHVVLVVVAISFFL